MKLNVVKSKDPKELSLLAVKAFFDELGKLPADRPVILGLCGGRSVVGLFDALKSVILEGQGREQYLEILSRTQFFMVDERLVPVTDPQSNFGMLKQSLFDSLVDEDIVNHDQLHPFHPNPSESDYGVARYTQELQGFGGVFSAIILGSGEDGHVAGLFPRHPLLSQTTATFATFFDSPKPPPERMSATVPLLCTAQVGLLMFMGEAKRDAYDAFNNPSSDLNTCPCTLVRILPNLIVITDL